ncbi:MAG: ElaA protein [Flavobacteriales bacterium]|jgi:ElaA protein
MQFEWRLKTFEELSTAELYDIMAERIRIFVVEQDCPYQEADGLDKVSLHMSALDEKESVAAYIRILPPGAAYKEAAIGRVIVAQEFRGQQLGRLVMERGMQEIAERWPESPIRIGAQIYLNKFYSSLGFVNEGEEYLEDGLPHIEMLYSKP